MTAKEFLSEYRIEEKRIKAKEEKILELKDKAISLSIRLHDKIQTTKQANGTERIICQYLDMEKELEKDVTKLKVRLKTILAIIRKMQDSREKAVIEFHYINGLNFLDISKEMYISERQVFRIHGKALEHIKEIVKNHAKNVVKK